MKVSLFTTSLASFGLEEALRIASEVGYEQVELMCLPVHFPLAFAEKEGEQVRRWLREAKLSVSAISVCAGYTDLDEAVWRASVEESLGYLRLCESFGTRCVKIMPGGPGSVEARPEHWRRFEQAMQILVPEAARLGLKLAMENHLRNLSDTIESTLRCLECDDSGVLGVNLDFCNVYWGLEDPLEAIDRFRGQIYFTHVKDGWRDPAPGRYTFLGRGALNYPAILRRLNDVGYDGPLSVECLRERARTDGRAWIAHELGYLSGLLDALNGECKGEGEKGRE